MTDKTPAAPRRKFLKGAAGAVGAAGAMAAPMVSVAQGIEIGAGLPLVDGHL